MTPDWTPSRQDLVPGSGQRNITNTTDTSHIRTEDTTINSENMLPTQTATEW